MPSNRLLLTPAHWDVIRCLEAGHTCSAAIATVLGNGVSTAAVDMRILRICRKLNCSRKELFVAVRTLSWASQRTITSLPEDRMQQAPALLDASG
jgi:hypothetical protein